MAEYSYQAYQQMATQQGNQNQGPRVTFFQLKNDGDEAIVRFPYSSPEQFNIVTVHDLSSRGIYRKVNCIRDAVDPIDNCPLCKAGVNLKNIFCLKIVDYVRGENGAYQPTFKIWERSASYAKVIADLMTEYGDISQMVWKIKRIGAKGSTSTTYNILPANPAIYKPEMFPIDFSGFDNYKIVGHYITNKDYDGLITYMQENNIPSTPAPKEKVATQPTPTYQTAPQAAQYQAPAQQYQAPVAPVGQAPMQNSQPAWNAGGQPQFTQTPRVPGADSTTATPAPAPNMQPKRTYSY